MAPARRAPAAPAAHPLALRLLLLLLAAASPRGAGGVSLSATFVSLQARDDAAPGAALAALAGYATDALPVSWTLAAPDPAETTTPATSYSTAPFALSAAGALSLAQPALLDAASSFKLTAVATNTAGASASLILEVKTSRALVLSVAAVAAQLAFGAAPRIGAPSLLGAGFGGSAGAPLATADANALALAQAMSSGNVNGKGQGSGGAPFGDVDLAQATITTTSAFFSSLECGFAVSGAPGVTTALLAGSGLVSPTFDDKGVFRFMTFTPGMSYSVSFSVDTPVGFVLAGGGGGGAGGNTAGNSGGGGGGGGGVAYAPRGGLTMLAGVAYTVTVGAGGAGGLSGFNGSNGGDTKIVGLAGSSIIAGGGGGGPKATADGGSGFGTGGLGGVSSSSGTPANGASFFSGGAGGAGYGGPVAPGANGRSISIPVNDGAPPFPYAGLLNGIANVGSGGGGGGSNSWGSGGSKDGGGAQGSTLTQVEAAGSLGGGGGGSYGDSRAVPHIGGSGGDGFATLFFCQGVAPTMYGVALADLASDKPPPSTAALVLPSQRVGRRAANDGDGAGSPRRAGAGAASRRLQVVPCVSGATFNAQTGNAPCVQCSVCAFGTVRPCAARSDAVCLASAWTSPGSSSSNSKVLLAARVQAFEGVTLLADLFACNGQLAGAGFFLPLQRAVPAGPALFFVPDGLGDSRPGLGGARFSVGSGLSNASFLPTRIAAVAGLDMGVVEARWTLVGVPSALLEPNAFSFDANGSVASISKLHQLSFSAKALSVVVPPGQLYPGYVYAVSCDLILAASLAFDYANVKAGALPAAAFAAAAPINYAALNAQALARYLGSASAFSPSPPTDVVLVSTRQLRNAFFYVHAPAAIASVNVAPASAPLWALSATSAGGDAALWAPATSAPPLLATLSWALAALPIGPDASLAVYSAAMSRASPTSAAAALGSAPAAAAFAPGSASVAAVALLAAALTGAPPFAGAQTAIAPGFSSALGVNVTVTGSGALTAVAVTASTLSPAAAAATLAASPYAALAPVAASAAAAQLQANALTAALLVVQGIPPHGAVSVDFFFFADATGAAALPSGSAPAASNAADPAAAALQQLALTNASSTNLPGWVALTAGGGGGGGGGGFVLPAGRAPTYQVRVAALAIDSEGACAVAVAPSAALVCPLGMFALLDGSTCAVCPSGSFSAAAGLAATAASPQPCSGCGAGSFSDAGASACLPCGAGSYSGARSSSCTSCQAGTASAVAGAASCASCTAGFFSPAAGAAACLPCAAGTLSAAGAASCSPCPAGSWCAGLTVTPCAAGLDAPAGSTSSANCIACAQSFYCPGGGSVQCAVGTVSPAGSTSAANCTALSAASVGAAISSLGNVSTPAGAIGALATASSIASFLDSSNATALNATGANATAALAAATAARGAVIAQIGALVNVLAGGAGGGAAALVASANVTNTTSLNSTAFQALLADTSIPLSPNATTAVAQALSALTSSLTQLSAAAAGDALDALSSISLLSLPVNVLSGAVDLAGGVAAAAANASAAGGNATAPPPVPPLPAATASLFLRTIGNVAAAVSQTSNATAAAAVQVKVAAALGAVSAAVLRAAIAGDPPTSVRAGAASAFNASAGAGYCGDALSLTVARLSSNGSLALGLGAPIAPCGGAAGSAGAALPAPALGASPAFLAGAARGASALGITAGSVDVSFVQNGRSPVPESAGFAALGALGPPAPLDTRVVSVVLQTRAGGKIAVADSSTPLELTLPLASGSRASSAALAVQAAYLRPSVSVACAASPRPSLVLVDCGPPVGKRNVPCAASATAYNGTYVCPSVSVQPQCVYWDVASGAWSSAGCVALTSTSGSITCACNHTTEFAARFSALAAQQQEIFARGADLFVQPGDKFKQYPHVAAILGVILGLTFLSLIVARALDREGAGRFYDSLQSDREVQFLARIENLKGGVFVLDRVLDHRVDAMHEKITQARLERQARAIAEAEGLTFLQRGVDLPADVAGAVSLHHVASDAKSRRHGVFTTSVLTLLGRGDTGAGAHAPVDAAASSASAGGGELPFANKLFVEHSKAAAPAAPSSVEVATAKDAPAAPAPKTSAAARALSILSGDSHAQAIYSRLTLSFESLSVSGGKHSRLEALWHSGAAGNSSDIAATFGLAKRDGIAAAAGAGTEGEGSAATPVSPSSRAIKTLLRSPTGGATERHAERLEAEEGEEAAAAAAASPEHHETAARVLDSVGGWSCMRAWRLRGFLLRTWVLSVVYQHPVLSLFSKFDPRLSRTLRVLVFASSLIADLWTTTFLYAFVVGGDSSSPLPDLTIAETIVVAVFSSLLQVPIGTLIGFLATRAGEAECECRGRAATLQ